MEWIELGELSEIHNGYAFKSKKYRDVGIRIIRITNVQKGYIEDSDPKYYDLKDMEGLDRFYLDENDILISLTGNVGRVARVTKEMLPAALNQRVASIKPKNTISNDYLFYMMNSNKFENICINEAKGVAQKNLGTTSLSKMKIPVPPIKTQSQIVEVLDEAQKLIKNRKEQLKLLDDLIESIFYDIFGDPIRNEKGWKEEKMTVASSIKSLNIADRFQPEDLVWLVNLNEIESNTGKLLDRKKVKFKDLPTSVISYNDEYILYSKLRPYLNKIILPDQEGYGTSELVPILPKKHVNKIYLFNLLKSKSILRFLEVNVSGAKMPRVVMKDFRNLKIPIPPLKLQNQFAEKVREIESQKQLLNYSLKLLKDNYNSLMQRAFKGELF